MIASLTLLFTILILGFPAAIVFIPWAMITGNATPLYNAAQKIVRLAFWLAGIRVETTGLERVPAHKACIFMANHVSNLDPPALIPRIPGRTSAFLKRSLMKIPLLGYGMKLGDFVPVDRDGRVESAIESVAEARRVLEKGIHITTFVEGTRSRDGRLLPFKKGPFYLAMEAGAPCVPVSIHGTESMMSKGSSRVRPGTAYITFHEPLDPHRFATREELMEAVRTAIASGLPEWMRDAGTEGLVLRLDDGVVTVVEQLLAHGVGVVAIREGADLDMQQPIGRVATSRNSVAALAQGSHQDVGIFGVGDGGDLHHDSGRLGECGLDRTIAGGKLRRAGLAGQHRMGGGCSRISRGSSGLSCRSRCFGCAGICIRRGGGVGRFCRRLRLGSALPGGRLRLGIGGLNGGRRGGGRHGNCGGGFRVSTPDRIAEDETHAAKSEERTADERKHKRAQGQFAIAPLGLLHGLKYCTA